MTEKKGEPNIPTITVIGSKGKSKTFLVLDYIEKLNDAQKRQLADVMDNLTYPYLHKDCGNCEQCEDHGRTRDDDIQAAADRREAMCD